MPDKIFSGAKRLFRDFKTGFVWFYPCTIHSCFIDDCHDFNRLSHLKGELFNYHCPDMRTGRYHSLFGDRYDFHSLDHFRVHCREYKSRNRFVRPLHNRRCPAPANRAKSSFFQYWFGSACHSHSLVHRLQIDRFPWVDCRTCRNCHIPIHIQLRHVCKAIWTFIIGQDTKKTLKGRQTHPVIFDHSFSHSIKNPPRVRGGFLVSSLYFDVSNCSVSVEPASAVVDDVPPETTCATSSK